MHLLRTLPSNLALCVNPDFLYVRARDPASGKTYVVAESRLAELPGAVPKTKKGGKKGEEPDKGFEVRILSWNASKAVIFPSFV